MKHFILGTAGHVDHGKSSLIKALTDVETDRLPEEKERGLSIDLGFAPLALDGPKGPLHVGVVDVPGHHKFLRNMIAGVGGFDACLLVVDCCEGVKPQTLEHLQILQMLQTKRGVVVLSKSDKTDEEGLEIAQWELEEALQKTFLAGAPMIATSVESGEGLERLRESLYELLIDGEERTAAGVSRLPLDRAFSKTGFGDVVTGSLWSGTLQVGDEVELLPQGAKGKVRGLQVHGQAVESAKPGQRVAVNLSGFDSDVLGRGQSLISPPGSLPLSERFAVSVTLAQSEPKLLKRKFRATFFQATGHFQVEINLVSRQEKDTEVFGQMRFPEPVLLLPGDRFLLRDETDQRLLGGGAVLALEEKPFKRSRASSFLSRYTTLAGGGAAGRFLQQLEEKGPQRISALKKQLGLSEAEWSEQLELLRESEQVVVLGKDRLWAGKRFRELASELEVLLKKMVQAASWKVGWSASELSSLLTLKPSENVSEVADALVASGVLAQRGPLYAPASHQPSLDEAAQKGAEHLLSLLKQDGYTPRDWDEGLFQATGGDKKSSARISEYLLGTEQVVRLSDKLVTVPSVLEAARESLAATFSEGFTASEARQTLEASRKYVIPILEMMDRKGWTIRLGDKRRIGR